MVLVLVEDFKVLFMRYFLLIFFFFISSVWGDLPKPVVLDGNEKQVKLTPHISFYLDKMSKHDINSIVSKSELFQKSTKEHLSFGHQPDSILWVTFTLQNKTDSELEYIFEYAISTLSNFVLYDEDGSLIGKLEDDTSRIKTLKESLGFVLNFSLPPHSTKKYYLKVDNHVSSVKLNLMLWKHYDYNVAKHIHWGLMLLLFGAILILLVYNFSLFIFTRDQSYLYYVFVMSGLLVHEIYVSGFIVFLTDESIFFNSTSIQLMVLFTFVFIPIFTRSFLELKSNMPLIDHYLKYVPLLLLSITLLTIYDLIPLILNRIIFIVTTLSIVIIGYIALFKGVKQAKYYVVGWTVLIISFILMALYRTGLISFDPEYYYLTHIAILFEALIFSIGLAARIKYNKEEKERSDANLILHQEHEKERLENEVSLRTDALTKALEVKNLLIKEVHHRVKNNLQIIISLLRLQVDSFDNKELQEAMLVSEQRINAMSSVHEMLYTQDDISEIKAKEYFNALGNNIQTAYNTFENIIVTIETDVMLNMERAIYTGLIINELLINSFKHAFDKEGGEINISLIQKDTEYILTVKDNGVGGELIGSDKSLGMLLVKTLVTQQLRGSINTINDSGITHTIRFEKGEL